MSARSQNPEDFNKLQGARRLRGIKANGTAVDRDFAAPPFMNGAARALLPTNIRDKDENQNTATLKNCRGTGLCRPFYNPAGRAAGKGQTSTGQRQKNHQAPRQKQSRPQTKKEKPMKNKLTDLNNHLFMQLERLGDEGVTDAELEAEIKRTKAITDISAKIIDNAALGLRAAALVAEYGGNFEPMLPMVENKNAGAKKNGDDL